MRKKSLKRIRNISGSFRDPDGFVFLSGNTLFRSISKSYSEDFDYLIKSGLYKSLVKQKLLIPQTEVKNQVKSKDVYKIIKPEYLKFISYPYEWCFGQLKDAALTTLKIQKLSLEQGMILKDSSAYNIQFNKGKPILIDTLSFEKYIAGEPWMGYRQFCQHFLAPLALMSLRDGRLNQLQRVFIDGIPLDLAASLLPVSGFLKLPVFSHIYLHSKSQQRVLGKKIAQSNFKMGKRSLQALIENLESAVKNLKWDRKKSRWGDYYGDTNYGSAGFKDKSRIIKEYLSLIKVKTAFDLGSNNGFFSRIIAKKDVFTVSLDNDLNAVEENYSSVKARSEINILPLVMDLTNPSPGNGWENEERFSLTQRGPVDLVIALALVHHLAISNNLPFSRIAGYFAELGRFLIIEFIPKGDSNADLLLTGHEKTFSGYNLDGFLTGFKKFFSVKRSDKIKGSKRMLFLMEKK